MWPALHPDPISALAHDPQTGTVTVIGNVGYQGEGLAFGRADLLFAGESTYGSIVLYKLDPASGRSTIVSYPNTTTKFTGLTLAETALEDCFGFTKQAETKMKINGAWCEEDTGPSGRGSGDTRRDDSDFGRIR